VDKTTGWTSHDVVARVRRLAGQKRVGHAGTLDPGASGVLPVLLGRATRLMDLVQSGRKTYVASVALGSATDTDDADGAALSTAPVPPLSVTMIEEALSRFRGEILQTPPAYSALKVQGQRAYDLARRGVAVELAPRPVTIDALSLLSLGEASFEIEVVCSKGTYIRALARDIAVALGTVGHMAALRRTAVGPFTLADAHTLDDINATLESHTSPAATAVRDRRFSSFEDFVVPSREADRAAPAFAANDEEARRLANGQSITTSLRADRVWVYDPLGRLLCLATADGSQLRTLLQL
jgi:tRNA pseudouridine55 synthase